MALIITTARVAETIIYYTSIENTNNAWQNVDQTLIKKADSVWIVIHYARLAVVGLRTTATLVFQTYILLKIIYVWLNAMIRFSVTRIQESASSVPHDALDAWILRTASLARKVRNIFKGNVMRIVQINLIRLVRNIYFFLTIIDEVF